MKVLIFGLVILSVTLAKADPYLQTYPNSGPTDVREENTPQD